MNKSILIGRLTKDPDLRTTQAGTPVCTFTLAVDRRFAKRNEENNQPTADFIPIVTWGKTAEFCNQYFQKGSKMCVEGRIQVRNYEAQDGTKRYVTEIVAESVEFVESKRNAEGYNNYNNYNGGYGGNYNNAPSGEPAENKTEALGPTVTNEEIPF